MHSSDHKRRGCTSIILVNVLLILLLSAGCAAAVVTDLQVSPTNPRVGDTVTIRGNASPYEVVCLSVNFSSNLSASNYQYGCSLDKMAIPADAACSLEVQGVKNLTVTTDALGIPISRTMLACTDADHCVEIALPSIPIGVSGGLDLKGASLGSDVPLIVTAMVNTTADKNGKFEYNYEVTDFPSGNVVINAGNETKEMTLISEDSHSGGKGTGEAKIVDLQTQSESPLPAPPETPSVSEISENTSNTTGQILPPFTQPESTAAPKTFMDYIWSIIEGLLKWLGLN